MKQKEVESVFSDLDALRTAAKHAGECLSLIHTKSRFHISDAKAKILNLFLS